MKIVLASSNKGKLKEIGQVLEPLAMTLLPQSKFVKEDAEETGLSFVENAIIKARHACLLSGLPALADDSGLEVDYLRGAPGIYSSRFAGPRATDADNNNKLLKALNGIPENERSARFHCLMVFMRHEADPTPLIAHGIWEGYILEQSRGQNGFGYDPLFFCPQQDCASAELTAEIKNKVSHRAQALKQLLRLLQNPNDATAY